MWRRSPFFSYGTFVSTEGKSYAQRPPPWYNRHSTSCLQYSCAIKTLIARQSAPYAFFYVPSVL